MTCKYFVKNAGGQPICKNSKLDAVRYCPFEFTMKKKAPQCCTGYQKAARKAYRAASTDELIQKIAHAAWCALPFHGESVDITFDNACGDTIHCKMSPTDNGMWKVHDIQTSVDNTSVIGKFRKALHRE